MHRPKTFIRAKFAVNRGQQFSLWIEDIRCESRPAKPEIIKFWKIATYHIRFCVLDIKIILMWIGTYRTCSHGLESHCHGLQLAFSSFSVYIPTGMTRFQVFKLWEQFGRVGDWEAREWKILVLNPMTVKVTFSWDRTGTLILFASSRWY
jgi:hypothetical protein